MTAAGHAVPDGCLSRVLLQEAARTSILRLIPDSTSGKADSVALADILQALLDAQPSFCWIAGFTADNGLLGVARDRLAELVQRDALRRLVLEVWGHDTDNSSSGVAY